MAIYDEFDEHSSASTDCELGIGIALRRLGDPAAARIHLDRAARAFTQTGSWLALARTTYHQALTYDDAPQRSAGLVAAWLAMQSGGWGLTEVAARARWRDELAGATIDAIATALTHADACLAAELIEALRSAPIAPNAPIPTGITPSGPAALDLPTIRPHAVDCGWQPALLHHTGAAEQIRSAGGARIRLRTATVNLPALLRPLV